MKDEATAERGSVGEMRVRRTTLADGRYLIYYTFGDEADSSRETDGEVPERAPRPGPAAAEERRV